MNIYFLFYIAVILYIAIPIAKIIWYDKLDNDLSFLLWCNYILILLLSFIYSFQYHIIYSILLSFTITISSFLLIRKIKSILGFYSLLSIPYFIFTVYTFSSLLILI